VLRTHVNIIENVDTTCPAASRPPLARRTIGTYIILPVSRVSLLLKSPWNSSRHRGRYSRDLSRRLCRGTARCQSYAPLLDAARRCSRESKFRKLRLNGGTVLAERSRPRVTSLLKCRTDAENRKEEKEKRLALFVLSNGKGRAKICGWGNILG